MELYKIAPFQLLNISITYVHKSGAQKRQEKRVRDGGARPEILLWAP